jgi:hypothetical protein
LPFGWTVNTRTVRERDTVDDFLYVSREIQARKGGRRVLSLRHSDEDPRDFAIDYRGYSLDVKSPDQVMELYLAIKTLFDSLDYSLWCLNFARARRGKKLLAMPPASGVHPERSRGAVKPGGAA